jgi:PAS domain S-box-containing protein
MGRDNPDALIGAIKLAPLAAVVTDPNQPDNPIIAVNHAFEALTGYCEAELIGVNCRILVGGQTDIEKSLRLRKAVETGTSVCLELVNYRKDGSSFLNAVMLAPVLDEDGKAIYFLGTQMAVPDGGTAEPRRAKSSLDVLTPKQLAVLRLMARGMRNRQIAAELGLAEKTIKMHRVALVRRLGVSSTMEAMRLAVQSNL